MMRGRPRLLVANLDAEIEMARAATSGPHRTVSAEAARRIAAAGRLMRVFGREGDRLWVVGEEQPEAAEEVLGWAETESVAKLRMEDWEPGLEQATGDRRQATGDRRPGGWREEVWRWRGTPEVVRAVNHRAFGLALAQANGWALEGARIVHGVGEIPREGEWIAKAPYSAAGRERVRWRGAIAGEARVHLERLIARFGEVLVEPWVERVVDLGCGGVIGERTVIFDPHVLENDERGVFRAVKIEDAGEHAGAVRATAEVVAEALAGASYRGPFGIDAYVWREGGTQRLQRLSEVNARLTFGLVARAAAEDSGRPHGPFELTI